MAYRILIGIRPCLLRSDGTTMHTVHVRRAVAAPIDEVFDWVVDGRNWGKVQALSTIPPAQHDDGSMILREIPGGTEVLCSSSFEVKSPFLAELLTRLYGHGIGLGFRMILRTAERALVRGRVTQSTQAVGKPAAPKQFVTVTYCRPRRDGYVAGPGVRSRFHHLDPCATDSAAIGQWPTVRRNLASVLGGSLFRAGRRGAAA